MTWFDKWFRIEWGRLDVSLLDWQKRMRASNVTFSIWLYNGVSIFRTVRLVRGMWSVERAIREQMRKWSVEGFANDDGSYCPPASIRSIEIENREDEHLWQKIHGEVLPGEVRAVMVAVRERQKC